VRGWRFYAGMALLVFVVAGWPASILLDLDPGPLTVHLVWVGLAYVAVDTIATDKEHR
jgi:hypothetical protein